tara:strand:- start:163 stop:330 length:168 start_codon:yes stop_codon:yes gene_type:complete
MKLFKNRYEAEIEDGQLWIYDRQTGWGGSFEAAEADEEFQGGEALLNQIAKALNY